MPDVGTLVDTGFIVLLFHAVLAPAAAIHATLYKRDSRAAFGWIALCILLPVAGPILYAIAGVNRVRSRAHRLGWPRLEVGYERGAEPVTEAPDPAELPEDFRELARIGRRLSHHALTAGPDEDLDRLTMLLSATIAHARERICIMTPYFLPRPFVHTKLFVVDGRYSLVGSTNWDPRSLRLNFELQVEVFGRAFAKELESHVRSAIEAGREVTLAEVDGRSLPARLRDSICWLFSPYL